MRRLRVLGVLIAFVVSASPLFGQAIGARAGVTWATVAGDDIPDSEVDYKTGFSFGAHVSLPIAPTLSIQPELNYMAFGAEVNDVDVTGTVDVKHVQIPVLLKLALPTPGFSPYVFAGPAISFEASCTLEAESGGVSASIDCDDPDAGFIELSSTMWSLIGGAGLGFNLGLGEATLGVRYDLGLNTLDDSDPAEDIKSRAISLMVGYSLGF